MPINTLRWNRLRYNAYAAIYNRPGRFFTPCRARSLALAAIRPGERVVTHCDGGGRASLAALAALRAGYADVGAYYLSFSDWASDESCPIER